MAVAQQQPAAVELPTANPFAVQQQRIDTPPAQRSRPPSVTGAAEQQRVDPEDELSDSREDEATAVRQQPRGYTTPVPQTPLQPVGVFTPLSAQWASWHQRTATASCHAEPRDDTAMTMVVAMLMRMATAMAIWNAVVWLSAVLTSERACLQLWAGFARRSLPTVADQHACRFCRGVQARHHKVI